MTVMGSLLEKRSTLGSPEADFTSTESDMAPALPLQRLHGGVREGGRRSPAQKLGPANTPLGKQPSHSLRFSPDTSTRARRGSWGPDSAVYGARAAQTKFFYTIILISSVIIS